MLRAFFPVQWAAKVPVHGMAGNFSASESVFAAPLEELTGLIQLVIPCISVANTKSPAKKIPSIP